VKKIIITDNALKALKKIKNRGILLQIAEKIDSLAVDTEKQGKPLLGELKGLWSARAVRQRYRIIYRISKNKVIVLLVGIRKGGEKKDIYELASKLFKHRLLS